MFVPVRTQEVSIEAGEEVDVNVHFDPSYCSDCQSRCEKQSVTVRFREHKHKVCYLHLPYLFSIVFIA